MSRVIESMQEGVRIIQLAHESAQNPFNHALETAVITALDRADRDADVRAVVLYGGDARSFSAGGDFNEVRRLAGGHEVDIWIDRVTDLYSALLRMDKPTVAAIDGFAIGMGFQFAMMCDRKVMAEGAHLVMPELKHGIGCSMGAAILGKLLQWNVMRRIIYDCDRISAEDALDIGLVDRVVPGSDLLVTAIHAAAELANYPQTAFRATKKVVNKAMLDILLESAAGSKEVHRASFAASDAQRHFQRVLKAKYVAPAA